MGNEKSKSTMQPKEYLKYIEVQVYPVIFELYYNQSIELNLFINFDYIFV